MYLSPAVRKRGLADLRRRAFSVVSAAMIFSCGDPPPSGEGNGSSSETGTVAVCGDGAVHVDEECDDANLVDHDGCDNDCRPSAVVGLAGRSCARLRFDDIRCWGPLVPGTDGSAIGNDEPAGAAPIVDLGEGVSTIVRAPDTGSRRRVGCALMADASVRCWESYDAGPLTPDAPVPLPEPALAVEVLDGRVCVLTETGALHCWGSCFYDSAGPFGTAVGECFGLGVGRFDEIPAETPQLVPLAEPVTDVAFGMGHACALSPAGDVRCWGGCPDKENVCEAELDVRPCLSGRCLGSGSDEYIGDDEPASDAALVDIGGRAIDVGAILFQTCALREDGRVVCWGQDVAGDLVIGDDESPAQAGLIDVESLAQIGTRGIAGRRSDGTVWRWELPSLVSQEVPLSGIAAALADECALMSTGSVRCWATSGWSGCGHAVCSPSEDVPIFEAE